MKKLADLLHAFMGMTVILVLLVFEVAGEWFCAVNQMWFAFSVALFMILAVVAAGLKSAASRPR
jgi:hypothetical protein